jgi:glycosyltransferase involved in cell wall biosynthesis
MPIKVLHVIGSLGCGGAQVVLKQIVEYSDANEFDMFVYPLRSRDVNIPIQGKIINRSYPNYDPRKFFTILKLCKQYNIDVLVAHLDKSVMACLFASFFCKSRVIVYEHGSVLVKGLLYFLYRTVLRLFWRRADRFIAVSKNIADYLTRNIGISSDRIRVVHNAVQTDVFNPQRISSSAAKANLKISESDIVVGFVGRLDPMKGVDLLIEAAALLLQSSKRYMFLIAGDGPQRPSLEKSAKRLSIENRVRFFGFCRDVPAVMAAFDIGVVPSRFEPFGIVCLELMSMKVPVISSGAGGMSEYITDEQTGLVLKQNTPEEICRCVERLTNDKQLSQKLKEAGYELAKHFGVDRYVEIFQEICRDEIRRQDKT